MHCRRLLALPPLRHRSLLALPPLRHRSLLALPLLRCCLLPAPSPAPSPLASPLPPPPLPPSPLPARGLRLYSEHPLTVPVPPRLPSPRHQLLRAPADRVVPLAGEQGSEARPQQFTEKLARSFLLLAPERGGGERMPRRLIAARPRSSAVNGALPPIPHRQRRIDPKSTFFFLESSSIADESRCLAAGSRSSAPSSSSFPRLRPSSSLPRATQLPCPAEEGAGAAPRSPLPQQQQEDLAVALTVEE
nr:unnamed protein product [Digitaria exilis]